MQKKPEKPDNHKRIFAKKMGFSHCSDCVDSRENSAGPSDFPPQRTRRRHRVHGGLECRKTEELREKREPVYGLSEL